MEHIKQVKIRNIVSALDTALVRIELLMEETDSEELLINDLRLAHESVEGLIAFLNETSQIG